MERRAGPGHWDAGGARLGGGAGSGVAVSVSVLPLLYTLCYTQSSPSMVSFTAPIKSPHTLHFVLLVAARKELVTGACVGEGELGFPGEPVGC